MEEKWIFLLSVQVFVSNQTSSLSLFSFSLPFQPNSHRGSEPDFMRGREREEIHYYKK